jgi:hypothetical protein
VKRPLVFVAVCIALAKSATAASSIVVNEYFNGTGSAGAKMVNAEYIEFAITGSMTSNDLAALTFGDSNGTTSALDSVFRFDKATLDSVLAAAGRSDFLPGTILVVKGTGYGAQNLSYNPLASNTTNNDLWSIELVAGLGAIDHAETTINGTISIANAGDIVWISASNPPANGTDVTGLLDAIGHDSSPGYIASQVIAKFGVSHILGANVATNTSVSNTGNSTVVLSQTAPSTMGTANGGANSVWFTGLRVNNFVLVPEPSRALLLLVGTSACILCRHRKPLPCP